MTKKTAKKGENLNLGRIQCTSKSETGLLEILILMAKITQTHKYFLNMILCSWKIHGVLRSKAELKNVHVVAFSDIVFFTRALTF